MADPTFIVHAAFYEEGSERHLGSADHTHPPAVGDIVWCDWSDDEGQHLTGAFEVVRRQWSYVQPGSIAYLGGDRGGMLDCIVRPCVGLFAPGDETDG